MLREDPKKPRVLPKAVALYSCFATVTLLGFLWEPLLMPSFFTWPYPFLLGAKRFVSEPASFEAWAAALGLGFLAVVFSASLLQRIAQPKPSAPWQGWVVAAIAIIGPLGLLTGFTWGVALIAGWPVGE